MKSLLIIVAIGEAVTGLLLVFAPGLVAGLLLGSEVAGTGVVVAGVAGIALIGLAAACWPGPASLGMTVYSGLVTGYLAWVGMTQATAGSLLWPVVGLHAVLVVVLATGLKREQEKDAPRL